MSHKPSRRGSADRDSSSRRPPRKTLQLCSQVRHTLEYVLTGELDDDQLRMLYVASVEPAPNANRLLVTVVPLPSQDPLDPATVVTHLHLHTGRMRSAVATAVNRKKAPDLIFRYLDKDPAADAPPAPKQATEWDDEE